MTSPPQAQRRSLGSTSGAAVLPLASATENQQSADRQNEDRQQLSCAHNPASLPDPNGRGAAAFGRSCRAVRLRVAKTGESDPIRHLPRNAEIVANEIVQPTKSKPVVCS
jgi:hypothetical protein